MKDERFSRSSDEIDAEIHLEEDISAHIFSTSAAMICVCLTVIGIFQIGKLERNRLD